MILPFKHKWQLICIVLLPLVALKESKQNNEDVYIAGFQSSSIMTVRVRFFPGAIS